MSRSHHDTTSSVSLFPFLAVLVCAMGALIFILLVTTHRLRQQAIAQAKQKHQQQTTTSLPAEPILPFLAALPKPDRRKQFAERPAPARAVDLNVELQATIARLSRERDDLRGILNQSQQTVAVLRQQRAASETAVTQARSKRALIRHQQELERIAQHSLLKQQTGLIGQIRQADKQLKTTRQKNATATSQYAILPFDAKTGTTRRPILIECTRHGLRFLPEDVTLRQDELDGFTIGYNPLLAGARSLVKYWSGVTGSPRTGFAGSPRTGFAGSLRTGFAGSLRKRPSLPRDDSDGRRHKPAKPDGPKPYVLLIVRPGGSISFYLARKFLARLGEPFGYELLETDHKLALSAVDPGAQAAVRDAIDAVLAERTRLTATIGRGGGNAGQGVRSEGRGTRSGYSAAGGRSSRHGSGLDQRPKTGGMAGQRVRSEGRGTRSGYSAAGGRSSRHGSGPDQRPKTGGMAGQRMGSRSSGTKGYRSLSGGAIGNAARPPGLPRQSTPISGRFGQQSSDGASSEGASSERASSRQRPSGEQQTAGRQSRNGTGTRSGRTMATNVGRSAGSHLRRGGNPSQPFPQFGQQRATGSPSSGMMRQPRRWGHSVGRTGIGFERSVNVKVGADRITIGNRLVVPVGQGETRKQLIEQVAAAIDREARAWEPAPTGFYWVPNIRFEILPGGNQFYERLNPTFRRWGLSTSARFPVGSSDRLDQRRLNE